MGINLMALLQSAGALPTPNSPEINVIGKKKVPAVPEPTPVEPILQDTPAPSEEPAKRRMLSDQQLMNRQGIGNLPEHKGMFGVKGTLRDVLGLVSDAFLVQSGNKPMYAPQRQAEKTSDAMAEMVNSPINAVQALLGAGQPEKAYELYKQFQTQGNTDAELDIKRQTAASTQSTAKSKQIEAFTTKFGQMLNNADTPEKLDATLRLAGKQAASIGLTLKDIGVDENQLTPGQREAFISGATTITQQNNLPLAQKRVGIAQQNADSATENSKSQRINANRPRSTPSGPQPTAVSEAAPLLKLVEEGKTLTPGQEAKLTRLGMSPQRGMSESEKRRAARSARNGSNPSDGGTGKYVIRNGKMVPK